MSYDKDVQEILTQEKINGNITLKGEEEDEYGKLLFENIINEIDQESTIENMERDVGITRNTQRWKINSNKMPKMYSNSSNSYVAWY